MTFTSYHICRLNTLKGTTLPLTEVILDFSTLRGTKRQILTSKRYDDNLRHFYIGVPPRGARCVTQQRKRLFRARLPAAIRGGKPDLLVTL